MYESLEKFPARDLNIMGKPRRKAPCLWVKSRICPVCGETFTFTCEIDDYAYSTYVKAGRAWVKAECCSYHCFRKAEKKRDLARTYKKRHMDRGVEL